ncbi:MAG TPA: hypothetical protein VG028_20715 [Terriglobia bacterium]|nr:hypothetical protein [Terriglobia bacterium]
MKSKDPKESRIGPVNPFALGGVFIEAAKKLGWMHEEQEERQRRYYITAQGFAEMEKLGMDLQRVVHYKPMSPLPENIPSRHERAMAQPGNSLAHHARPRQPLRHDDRQHFRHDERRPPRHHDRQHDRPHDRHRH